MTSLLVVRVAEPEGHFLLVREYQHAEEPHRIPVPRGEPLYGIRRATHHGVARETARTQRPGVGRLEYPRRCRSVRVLDVEMQHRVGIDELHLVESPRDLDRLVHVVLRRQRVVGRYRDSRCEQSADYQAAEAPSAQLRILL